MATLKLDLLNSAWTDKLIPKQLSDRQKVYLHPSVVTANTIYWLIQSEPFLDYEQIAARTQLHENTVKQFIRWLQEAELIEVYEVDGATARYSRHAFQIKNTTARRF